MKSTNALVVMVKAPIEGEVKTRLAPALTDEEATALYATFIEDTFKTASKLPRIEIIAAYTPEGKEAEISKLIPDNVPLTPQKGRDLGERMAGLFDSLFLKGYSKVAIIGSDSPDLPGELIEEAFSALPIKDNGKGVVLGPATDGGYYLIALNSPREDIFKDIPWSTASVLEETLKRCGNEAKLLCEWGDVDTASDLLALYERGRAVKSIALMRRLNLYERLKSL